MTLTRRALAAAALAGLALSAPMARAADSTGYLPVNGVDYYYEIAGDGPPMLLLHGGLGSHDMFDPVLGMLLAEREVIAVDLHGHGRTALTDRPLDLVAMGDDMGILLDRLGYPQVDVLGYSMGGGVGFQLAAQHPGRVRRLALVSAGYARDGFFPDILDQQAMVGAEAAPMMRETPMYEVYAAVSPRPDDFPRLLDAIGDLMRRDYDWSAEARSLEVPTMLVYGDADMYRPEHMIDFFALLGGGQKDGGWMREGVTKHRLAILPGRTHYDIFLSMALYDTVMPFLDGTEATPAWGGTQ